MSFCYCCRNRLPESPIMVALLVRDPAHDAVRSIKQDVCSVTCASELLRAVAEDVLRWEKEPR